MEPAGRKDFSIDSILANKSVAVAKRQRHEDQFRPNIINDYSSSAKFIEEKNSAASGPGNFEKVQEETCNCNIINCTTYFKLSGRIERRRRHCENVKQRERFTIVKNLDDKFAIVGNEKCERNSELIVARTNTEVFCDEKFRENSTISANYFHENLKTEGEVQRNTINSGKTMEESENKDIGENETLKKCSIKELSGEEINLKQDLGRECFENEIKEHDKYQLGRISENRLIKVPENHEEKVAKHRDVQALGIPGKGYKKHRNKRSEDSEIAVELTGSQVELLKSLQLEETEEKEEREEKEENGDPLFKAECMEKFAWLRYTRYEPPKIPRRTSVDKNKRRPSLHPRIPFSMFQLDFLEKRFRGSAYLSKKDVMEISATLMLPANRVKIWFQNRRARQRREVNKS